MKNTILYKNQLEKFRDNLKIRKIQFRVCIRFIYKNQLKAFRDNIIFEDRKGTL